LARVLEKREETAAAEREDENTIERTSDGCAARRIEFVGSE
jgi:hypothetical protein